MWSQKSGGSSVHFSHADPNVAHQTVSHGLFHAVLGGLVVIVLETGPKVRGLKPGQGDESLRAIKIRSTISFEGEVKPSAPCRKILLNVKNS
jgi:hypothetical protein